MSDKIDVKRFCIKCGKATKNVKYCNRKCYGEDKRVKNIIKIFDTHAEILFKNNNNRILIDLTDIDKLKEHNWRMSKNGYAITNINKKTVLLHRFLLKPEVCQQIDHINRNKLDNRRFNLRICTFCENMQNLSLNKRNTTGFSGISYNKKSGKYYVYIQKFKIRKFVGSFQTLQNAIDAKNNYEENYNAKMRA